MQKRQNYFANLELSGEFCFCFCFLNHPNPHQGH